MFIGEWQYPNGGPTVDPGTPDTHMEEWTAFEMFKDYSIKSFDDSQNPESGPSDDWQIWKITDLDTYYQASVQKAKDWMYPMDELTQ